MISLLEWGWLLTTFLALTFASYNDVKNRIIPDKIWVFQLLLGIMINVVWFLENNSFLDIVIVLSSIIMAALLFIIIVFTGAMGVGDAKAFFCLGISLPVNVFFGQPILPYNEILPPIVYIFIYFGIINLIVGLSIFGINLFQLITGKDLFSDVNGSKLQKFGIMIEGIKVDKKTLEKWDHYNISERFDGTEWYLYTPRFEAQLTDEEYEKLEKQEKEDAFLIMNQTSKSSIWVRPQMPGIVYILVGFILYTTIGPIFGFIF